VRADTPLDVACQRAETLRRQVGSLSVTHGVRPMAGVSVSIGVAALPEHGTTPEALLAAADHALYDATRASRDRVTTAPADPEIALHPSSVS